MNDEVRKFLDAEKNAEKLVESLEKIISETSSYQTAKEELEDTNENLLELIKSIEKVANSSYEVIETLKEIGSQGILIKLSKIEDEIKEGNNQFRLEQTKQSKSLEGIKKLILFTLFSSILAIIISIIALLR
jgi:ERCC4-type nuclease